jgi:hypothetical protein
MLETAKPGLVIAAKVVASGLSAAWRKQGSAKWFASTPLVGGFQKLE